MKSLKRQSKSVALIIFSASAFALSGCEGQSKQGSSYILLSSDGRQSQGATKVYSGSAFPYALSFSLSNQMNDTVLLSAHLNSSCSMAANGILSAPGPHTMSNGLATFENLSYTLPGSLEQSIYLLGAAQTSQDQVCSAKVEVVHYFNETQGTALFQPMENGAGDAPPHLKYDLADDAKTDSKGRYVFSGQSGDPEGYSYLAVWRYYPDGTLDTNFGNGSGFALFPHSGDDSVWQSVDPESNWGFMEVDSTDRYILAGTSENPSTGESVLVIWRFITDGHRDPHFGSGKGFIVFDQFGSGAAGSAEGFRNDEVTAFKVDQQGRYVILGYSSNSMGVPELTIWRYLESGELDLSFGGGTGYTVFHHNEMGAAGASFDSKLDIGWDIQIDSGGRYVITGTSSNSVGGNEMTIWRYLPDGSLDTSFGGGPGYTLFQHDLEGAAGASNDSKVDAPNSSYVRIDAQGRYVIVGNSLNRDGAFELVIWRYLPDGSLDSSFGSGSGYVLFNHETDGAAGANSISKDDIAEAFEIDAQGRYIIAGVSLNSDSNYEPVLWRYNSDGSLDPTFAEGTGFLISRHNQSGLAGAHAQGKDDQWWALSLDKHGRYLLAGASLNSEGGYELAIWRYLPEGKLDKMD